MPAEMSTSADLSNRSKSALSHFVWVVARQDVTVSIKRQLVRSSERRLERRHGLDRMKVGSAQIGEVHLVGGRWKPITDHRRGERSICEELCKKEGIDVARCLVQTAISFFGRFSLGLFCYLAVSSHGPCFRKLGGWQVEVWSDPQLWVTPHNSTPAP